MEKSDSSRRKNLQILAQLILEQTPASAAEFNFETIPSSDFPRAYNAWVLIRKCPPRNPPTWVLHVLPVKLIFPKHSKKNNYFLPTRSARQHWRFSPYVRVLCRVRRSQTDDFISGFRSQSTNEKITWPLAKCFMLSARGRGEVRRGQHQKILGTEGSNHNHNYFSNEESIFIDPAVLTIC